MEDTYVAGAMIKEYEERNEYLMKSWYRRYSEIVNYMAIISLDKRMLKESFEKEESVVEELSINISGSWKYASDRGTAEIKQSGNDVTMILSVKPRQGKGHYTIIAKLNGYTLEGDWEFTAALEEFDPENFNESDCKKGRFFAKVNADVSKITVSSSTEDKCSPGHGWHLVVFSKK